MVLPSTSSNQTIHTVSQLNREVRYLLEDNFLLVWVEGELSNLKIPTSGHWYFTLKDEHAQVRCALFRLSAQSLKFKPKDGMHVIIRGRVSLYEPRGDFQIIAEYMEEAGSGALQRAFEALKQRLAQEGLFDAVHKKPLPTLPKTIGVITSPTGAAIRDILSVLKRRFPSIPILIYPVSVQGNEAAGQIVNALRLANERKECDVLILARGGGSMEDLWPFNEEIVARAIYHSDIPVITGVGHEIDITIADFVADHRAATPSAAAELVSPDATEFIHVLLKQEARLTQCMKMYLIHIRLLVSNLEKCLPHPKKRLQDQAQYVDYLEQRLLLGMRHFLKHHMTEVTHLSIHLRQQSPKYRLVLWQNQVQALERSLKAAWQHHLSALNQTIAQLMRALESVSPLNTLERGYAIVTHAGAIVDDAKKVVVGDALEVRLAKGKLISTVTSI